MAMKLKTLKKEGFNFNFSRMNATLVICLGIFSTILISEALSCDIQPVTFTVQSYQQIDRKCTLEVYWKLIGSVKSLPISCDDKSFFNQHQKTMLSQTD